MATIKGITIEIAGKTSGLVDSLKQADSALKSTNDALKAVNKALELDPSNVELLAQKQALLTNAVEATSDRLETLKATAELAAQGLEDGTTSREQYAQLSAEIATTEHNLSDLTDQANNVGGALTDAGDAAQEAGDQAERSGENAEEAGEGWDAFGAMAQGAAQAITTYVIDAITSASEALVDFTAQAVQGYGQFEQLEGGITKLFGEDAAATVLANAENAFANVGISSNEYLETITSFSASLISSLGGDTEAAAALADMALSDMSDNANTFGRDIDSIMTVYQGLARGVYSTLDNLSLGFAGTQEGMIELINASGVLRTEGGVFTRQIESLDEVTFADMINAIHAVQEQLNITGTTANEAASTVEGSINMTSAAWQDLVNGLGNSEADIGQLIDNLVNSALAAKDNIVPVVEQVLENLVVLVDEIGPVIEELLPEVLDGVLPILVESASSLIIALVSELPSLLKILTAAIPSLLNELIPAILEVLPQIVSAGLDIVVALASSLGANAPLLIPSAVQAVNEICVALLDHIDDLLLAGMQLLIGLGLGIVAAIPDMLDFFPEVFTAIEDTITEFFEGLWTSAETWGADMIQNFVDGITSRFSNLVSSVENVASTIASYLHFSVPDVGPLADFDESGGDMIDVFAEGMLNELGTLQNALTLTGNTIAGGVTGSDYSGVLGNIAQGVAGLGSQPTVVNVYLGDEEFSSFVVNANRNYDYQSGGY